MAIDGSDIFDSNGGIWTVLGKAVGLVGDIHGGNVDRDIKRIQQKTDLAYIDYGRLNSTLSATVAGKKVDVTRLGVIMFGVILLFAVFMFGRK